jgi:ABC-type sugar transport system substrate-binding protein
MHPTAHRLLAKCDGVLRLPGDSTGADNDVRIAQTRGIPVWTALDEIPAADPAGR